jgi:hypothetical protein
LSVPSVGASARQDQGDGPAVRGQDLYISVGHQVQQQQQLEPRRWLWGKERNLITFSLIPLLFINPCLTLSSLLRFLPLLLRLSFLQKIINS